MTPGIRFGSRAELFSSLEITCAPYDEMWFQYEIALFSLRTRRPFVFIKKENESCGFIGEEVDEVAIPLLMTGLVIASAGGCAALLATRKQASTPTRPQRYERVERTPEAGDRAEEHAGDGVVDRNDDKEESGDPDIVVPVSLVEQRTVVIVPPAIKEDPAPAAGPVMASSRQYAAVNVGDAAVVGSIECVEQRPLNLEFVAKVANQADEAVMCSIVGEARDGKGIFFPDPFWVQGQSAAAVEINTFARFPWHLERLVLRMKNSTLSCTAETIVPVPLAVRAAQAALFVAVVIACLALTLLWYMRPRISAFAVPQAVSAGSTAHVAYATEGWGTTSFYVTTDNGPVRHGITSMGRHEFSFPTMRRPHTYVVRLTVDGFAGGTSVEEELRTLMPQRAARSLPQASIDVLEVNPPIATSGAPFSVRYVLNGPRSSEGGKVSILDSVGFPIASAAANASGETSLVAPSVLQPTTFRIELEIVKNGRHAQAATGLLVMPNVNHEAAAAQADYTADQLLNISPRNPRSGQMLVIRPLQYPSTISITLQDDRGNPVGTKEIATAGGTARFLLPIVSHDRKMSVIASYEFEGAQHVAIKPILVRAAESSL